MRALFVDFDGVLNSQSQAIHCENDNKLRQSKDRKLRVQWMVRETDEWNVRHLKYIISNVPALKVVISTNWRKFHDDADFKAMFKKLDIDPEIIGGRIATRFGSDSSTKPYEIRNYVKERGHKWENVVILDDYNLFNSEDVARSRLVQTDYLNGLTYSNACAAIKLFLPVWEEPRHVF